MGIETLSDCVAICGLTRGWKSLAEGIAPLGLFFDTAVIRNLTGIEESEA